MSDTGREEGMNDYDEIVQRTGQQQLPQPGLSDLLAMFMQGQKFTRRPEPPRPTALKFTLNCNWLFKSRIVAQLRSYAFGSDIGISIEDAGGGWWRTLLIQLTGDPDKLVQAQRDITAWWRRLNADD